MHRRIILPNKIDMVVASYGGVGTSFLLNFLKHYIKTNDPSDSDGFKHSPLPPISFNPNVKFVYVFGNPQMAAISLFRRNIHRAQSKKLQRWGKNMVRIPMDMTLQEYASLGVDRFYFENHFFNWYEKYLTGIPTLFVRYETIFDNIKPLLEFAGIPESAVDRFPSKKQRKSQTEAVPEKTATLLDTIYGDFANKLEKLNDIELRQKGTRKAFSVKYVDMQYGKALTKQASHEFKRLLYKYASLG